jgi:phage shock protein A
MRQFDRISRKIAHLEERRHDLLDREIRHVEDTLADVEHELSKWGFARTPSEIRRMRERIEGLEAKLETLRGLA